MSPSAGVQQFADGVTVLLLPGADGVPLQVPVSDLTLPDLLTTVPLLTAAEEVDLAFAAEAGALAEARLATGVPDAGDIDAQLAADLAELAAAGREAFTRLVLANMRLVDWLARRRLAGEDRALDHADLVAEGLRGLIRAAHKWDYQRGFKFSTYAVQWISTFQQRASRRATGIPLPVYEQQRAIRRSREALATELGRTPTPREVSLRVGLSVSRIATLESYRAPARLDAPRGQDGWSLLEVLTDQGAQTPEQDAVAAELRDEVARLVDTLNDRQRRVVALRFGLEGIPALSVGQVAARLKVPVRLVESTLTGALADLRAAAGDLDPHELLG